MAAPVTHLVHPKWGACELIGTEGTNWLIRVVSSGQTLRFPSEARREFRVEGGDSPTVQRPVPIAAPASLPSSPPQLYPPGHPRLLRRAFESLRTGLPPLDGVARQLAMGFDAMEGPFHSFLQSVESGGGSLVINGQYGQGKTFSLRMLQEIGLELGFATSLIEIDISETRLDRPHQVYRAVLQNLRLPGSATTGAAGLAVGVESALRTKGLRSATERHRWLTQSIESPPLCWLFTDPEVAQKPGLLGLLAGDPTLGVHRGRRSHQYWPESAIWPYFRYGTQGDVAANLLSSIGLCVKHMGHKGLLLLMDEMEEWQALRWQDQTRACNLVGGLIWGASAAEGQRERSHEPAGLWHSGWGGASFSTRRRCHLGLAIALTPRSDADDPIHQWRAFGPVDLAALPQLTERRLRDYCATLATQFASAYGIKAPSEQTLSRMAGDAVQSWKQDGLLTTRSAVQSIVTVLDTWRGSLDGVPA